MENFILCAVNLKWVRVKEKSITKQKGFRFSYSDLGIST